jgi:repressor LexA
MIDELQGIVNRLKESIDKSGLSYVELERITKISKSSIQRYASGATKKIPIDAIQAIASAVGVSAAYIMGWESNVEEIPFSKTYMRPLYDSVAAGLGVPAENTIVGYIPTHIQNAIEKEKYIWVNVQGDSMSPLIDDGSQILIRLQDSVDSGQVAVALIDGEEAVVKKVNYGDDWIELISVNPYYPPRRFEKAEVQRVRIVGVVKKVSKDLQ